MSLSDIATYAEVGEVSKEVFEMDENKCYAASHPVASTATSEGKNSSVKDGKKGYQLTIIVLVVVMMLILAAACACGAFTLAEISKLKAETASLHQITQSCLHNVSVLEDMLLSLHNQTELIIEGLEGGVFSFTAPSCATLLKSEILLIKEINSSFQEFLQV